MINAKEASRLSRDACKENSVDPWMEPETCNVEPLLDELEKKVRAAAERGEYDTCFYCDKQKMSELVDNPEDLDEALDYVVDQLALMGYSADHAEMGNGRESVSLIYLSWNQNQTMDYDNDRE